MRGGGRGGRGGGEAVEGGEGGGAGAKRGGQPVRDEGGRAEWAAGSRGGGGKGQAGTSEAGEAADGGEGGGRRSHSRDPPPHRPLPYTHAEGGVVRARGRVQERRRKRSRSRGAGRRGEVRAGEAEGKRRPLLQRTVLHCSQGAAELASSESPHEAVVNKERCAQRRSDRRSRRSSVALAGCAAMSEADGRSKWRCRSPRRLRCTRGWKQQLRYTRAAGAAHTTWTGAEQSRGQPWKLRRKHAAVLFARIRSQPKPSSSSSSLPVFGSSPPLLPLASHSRE